ncbi:nitroreductase [Chloroflexota bacterium]
MEVIEAIRTRRSTRAFKPDPVPRKVLEEILDTCRWAPSWANSQSWEFAIVGGKTLDELKKRLEEKAKVKAPETPEIPKPKFSEPHLARGTWIRDNSARLMADPRIKDPEEQRRNFTLKVTRFLDAPNAIIIYMERDLSPYLIHDVGIMVQTICMAAHGRGLGTCITARVMFYPDVLREVLKIPESKIIVMGIDIGYPDPDAPINNYERPREPLDTFTHWYDV